MPPIRSTQERIVQTLAPMAAGTLKGTLPQAARPVTPVGEVRTPSGGGGVGGLVFNFRGAVLTAVSDPIPAPSDFALASVAAALRVAGTTSTVVQLEVNGVSVGSVTLASGDTFEEATTSALIYANDILQARVTSAGTGADGLGVTPKAVGA